MTPRTLALVGDETGCNLWRTWQPFDEIRRHGLVADWAPLDGCPQCGATRPDEYRKSNVKIACGRCGLQSRASDVLDMLLPRAALGYYNVLVTPRIAWPVEDIGDRWISAIHKAGLCWLFEIDDDVFSPTIVDRQMRLFEVEHAKGAKQLEWQRTERIRLLARSDGVTVSCERLATIARLHLPDAVPVYVIPNFIDADWFRMTLRGGDRLPELRGKLTIGWCGGTRDERDLTDVAAAWAIIAERYPDVHFVVQGFIPDTLADAVPKHRRRTLPWLPLAEYPRAMKNIDIGICSVAPSVFNTAKTPIKWFEFTLAGAVCVVSKTLYGPVVTDGHDGYVANTTEEWIEKLTLLIESEERRREMQHHARVTVMQKHSLKNNWWRWPEAWSDAVAKFQEKNARKLVLAHA